MFTGKISLQRNIPAALLCAALFAPSTASALEKKDVIGFWATKGEDSEGYWILETRFHPDNSYEFRTVETWDEGEIFRTHVFGTWEVKGNMLITKEDGNRCRMDGGLGAEPCDELYVDTFALVVEGNLRTLVYDEEEFDGPLGDFVALEKAFTLPSLFASTRILPGTAQGGRTSAARPGFGLRRSVDSRSAWAFDAAGRNLSLHHPAVPVLLVPKTSRPDHRPSLAKPAARKGIRAKSSRGR